MPEWRRRQAHGRGRRWWPASRPNFNTKVARPAYAGVSKHPHLFDEAHHNFHTAGGRYKPFADLMTSDGYVVIPNREKFSRRSEEGRYPGDRQCVGWKEWASQRRRTPRSRMRSATHMADSINDGGSLLFITPRWAPLPRAWPGGWV